MQGVGRNIDLLLITILALMIQHQFTKSQGQSCSFMPFLCEFENIFTESFFGLIVLHGNGIIYQKELFLKDIIAKLY